jgi:hypothetical protein
VCYSWVWVLSSDSVLKSRLRYIRNRSSCRSLLCLSREWVYWSTSLLPFLSVTPGFKAKTRCSSYVCPGSSCHTYGQNVSTEYQCLYYIISYYKNLLQVQKGLNSGMDTILPQAVDRRFHMRRRNLHQRTPHLLSSRA